MLRGRDRRFRRSRRFLRRLKSYRRAQHAGCDCSSNRRCRDCLTNRERAREGVDGGAGCCAAVPGEIGDPGSYDNICLTGDEVEFPDSVVIAVRKNNGVSIHHNPARIIGDQSRASQSVDDAICRRDDPYAIVRSIGDQEIVFRIDGDSK